MFYRIDTGNDGVGTRVTKPWDGEMGRWGIGRRQECSVISLKHCHVDDHAGQSLQWFQKEGEWPGSLLRLSDPITSSVSRLG